MAATATINKMFYIVGWPPVTVCCVSECACVWFVCACSVVFTNNTCFQKLGGVRTKVAAENKLGRSCWILHHMWAPGAHCYRTVSCISRTFLPQNQVSKEGVHLIHEYTQVFEIQREKWQFGRVKKTFLLLMSSKLDLALKFQAFELKYNFHTYCLFGNSHNNSEFEQFWVIIIDTFWKWLFQLSLALEKKVELGVCLIHEYVEHM